MEPIIFVITITTLFVVLNILTNYNKIVNSNKNLIEEHKESIIYSTIVVILLSLILFK